MRDDPLARALYISGGTESQEYFRERLWDDTKRSSVSRAHWEDRAGRMRSYLGISSPPKREHPLPNDVVRCPLCGDTRGPNGCSVDVGDDDSVRVDDVVGILSPAENQR